MKNICLYFQVHQPFRLKHFPFMDIGKGYPYFDEDANNDILLKVARNCYLPANKLLLELIKANAGKFRVSFSISGTALDQFEMYIPELLDSFRALADTGCVEFLAETYGHSLSMLKNTEEFIEQVKMHVNRTTDLFGQRPTVFRNTELIYNDGIGDLVSRMGFSSVLTEGAAHVLHWKSPHYVYNSAANPDLKLLLKDFRLSDDVAFRFSDQNWHEWPLTANKFAHWLNASPQQEEVVNLFMDYETFGEHHAPSTGIMDFLAALPQAVLASGSRFVTPSEATANLPAIGTLSIPQHISWADEARDLSAWLGNDLQKDAFETSYTVGKKIRAADNESLYSDWLYLQASDHFYYMSTKGMEDGNVHSYFSPYNNPFDAFVNYMNVLTDLSLRTDKCLERKKTTTDERYAVKA